MKDPTPSGAGDERIREYLAGRLDAAEAERFEERMFADDELAAEVQRALEIKAAAAPAAATPATRRLPRRAWFAFAAAASAAALAVGIVWLQQPPPEPVFRGIEQLGIQLEVEADAGARRARWAPVAGAAGYEVQVLARDGRVLQSFETRDPSATIEIGAPADPASTPAFIEVTALDGLGQILRRSERVAL